MTRTSLLHKALFLCGISALALLLGGCATSKIKNLTIQMADAEGYGEGYGEVARSAAFG
jgi:hypothetical protein